MTKPVERVSPYLYTSAMISAKIDPSKLFRRNSSARLRRRKRNVKGEGQNEGSRKSHVHG